MCFGVLGFFERNAVEGTPLIDCCLLHRIITAKEHKTLFLVPRASRTLLASRTLHKCDVQTHRHTSIHKNKIKKKLKRVLELKIVFVWIMEVEI